MKNGVSPEFFQSRPSRHPASGLLRLLSVGRLVNIKGHRFARWRRRKRLLEQCHLLGLSETVKIESPRPAVEMPQVYRSHDILVMPSLFEGMPVAALELEILAPRSISSPGPRAMPGLERENALE